MLSHSKGDSSLQAGYLLHLFHIETEVVSRGQKTFYSAEMSLPVHKPFYKTEAVSPV